MQSGLSGSGSSVPPPVNTEERVAWNGLQYTYAQFEDYYGKTPATLELWNAASPVGVKVVVSSSALGALQSESSGVAQSAAAKAEAGALIIYACALNGREMQIHSHKEETIQHVCDKVEELTQGLDEFSEVQLYQGENTLCDDARLADSGIRHGEAVTAIVIPSIKKSLRK